MPMEIQPNGVAMSVLSKGTTLMARWTRLLAVFPFHITSGMRMKYLNSAQGCNLVRKAMLCCISMIATACSLGSSAANETAQCTVRNPIKQAIAGRFTAPTKGDVRWSMGGILHVNDRVLCPYLYSRVWGESGRATSRLVIFSGDYTYLGSYSLTAPQAIRSKNNILYITTMTGDIDKISFQSGVLPKQIYIDGELTSLFK